MKGRTDTAFGIAYAYYPIVYKSVLVRGVSFTFGSHNSFLLIALSYREGPQHFNSGWSAIKQPPCCIPKQIPFPCCHYEYWPQKEIIPR